MLNHGALLYQASRACMTFFFKHRQLLPIPSITPGCSAEHQAQGGGGKLQEMGVGPPRMWYFAEIFAHLRYL
jgi:hypothetical protein